jgi:two-component system chemotaxis response regulator CheY
VTTAARKPGVYLADDDPDMRALLRLTLRSAGYEVVGEGGNGETVLEDCRQLRPQILLLDINMPGLGGLEVLDQVRKDLPGAKVIMISADPTLGRVTDALRKGAHGFVVKPFNAAKLLDDIGQALARAG